MGQFLRYVSYFAGMSGLVRTGYAKLEIKDNMMEEGSWCP